ncbi:phosphoribosylanthranilate isomerase [Burkholderiaceae bacterium DAT-1]|nr:phosphoribosylanthranilate isomerase [Burkholderiaceae bacterium DAT-1]
MNSSKSFCRIKICGIKDPQMAVDVARLGADAIGLVFYPPSVRNLDVGLAREIALSVPPFVSVTGLFVNAAADTIGSVLQHVPLDVLQFHGQESRDECERWGRPYLKAVSVKPDLNLVEYARRYPSARGLLCDTPSIVAPGGTGECFDWGLIPDDLPLPLILSGGLHPGNVGDAIAQTRPWAVDVSSGVERVKGVKDISLIARFIEAVRQS